MKTSKHIEDMTASSYKNSHLYKRIKRRYVPIDYEILAYFMFSLNGFEYLSCTLSISGQVLYIKRGKHIWKEVSFL